MTITVKGISGVELMGLLNTPVNDQHWLFVNGVEVEVLPDFDGNPFDVAGLRGRKVLLLAWASW